MNTTKNISTNNMFKDTFFHGLIIGTIIPALATWGLLTLNEALIADLTHDVSFRSSTMVIIAISMNVIPTMIANKRMADNFMRGLMIPTIIAAFTWFFYFDPLLLLAEG